MRHTLLGKKVIEKAISVVTAVTLILSVATMSFADLEQPDIKLPPLEDVQAAAYCVFDKTAGEIILSSNPDQKVYPASMTKIMTAALALDYLDTADTLTASANAMGNISSDSTVMGVCVGETTTVSEYLYGLMLPSGNDAANVLAEGVIEAIFQKYPADSLDAGPDGINAKYFLDYFGMSELEILSGYKLSAFALLMNYRAKAIGCNDTNFVNAHGLHDDNHYTTASDLTKIMAMACENPTFCKLIHTPTHYFAGDNVHKEDGWSIVTNSNKILIDPWLIAKTSEGYDTHAVCMVGGKTGSTSMAGTGMTTYSVNENGHELFIAVCGIPMELYSYQTRYVASVVAYGNMECWTRDPVTVIPGKIGDYQSGNITEAERAVFDPLFLPSDAYNFDPDEPILPVEETEEEGYTGGGDSTTTESGEIVSRDPMTILPKDETPKSELVKWIEANLIVSGIIVALVVLILVLLFAIIVRLIRRNSRKRRKSSKNAVRRPYIGEVIREMPDTKKLNKKD